MIYKILLMVIILLFLTGCNIIIEPVVVNNITGENTTIYVNYTKPITTNIVRSFIITENCSYIKPNITDINWSFPKTYLTEKPLIKIMGGDDIMYWCCCLNESEIAMNCYNNSNVCDDRVYCGGQNYTYLENMRWNIVNKT